MDRAPAPADCLALPRRGDRPPPPPIVLVGRRPGDADAGVAALHRADHAELLRLAQILTGSEEVASVSTPSAAHAAALGSGLGGTRAAGRSVLFRCLDRLRGAAKV